MISRLLSPAGLMGLNTMSRKFVARSEVRQIEVVGLCWIFGGQRVNLVDGRNDAKLLAPLADGEAGLFHLHAMLHHYGTGYLEVGESIDLGCTQ